MKHKPSKPVFQEKGASPPNPARQEILAKRINELALKIEGSKLEGLINKLYKELEEKGISFKPKCYLSDEWGCPNLVPVIGIPFYLADSQLSQLETELTGIETENDQETMIYLRHEAGHAFNYAHKLYLLPEWDNLFGAFSHPYREEYKTRPFSASFVRHIPGWYAQKHPDDDFAETFAVWLTPAVDWENKYKGTNALHKLIFVDRIVKKIGAVIPSVPHEFFDTPVEELSETLNSWYQENEKGKKKISLPQVINEDLLRLFPYTSGQPAALFLNAHRHRLSQKINFWTGIDRHLTEDLLEELVKRLSSLKLKVDQDQTEEVFTNLTAFVTTLVMNHLYTNTFAMI